MAAVVMAPPQRRAARPAQHRPVGNRAVMDRRRAQHRRAARRAAARRRLVVLVIMAVAVLTFVVSASLQSQASDVRGDAGLEATVVVGPGDTVWDIAVDYLPAGEHAHAYAARILQHNGVEASAVAPGSVLRLPRP